MSRQTMGPFPGSDEFASSSLRELPRPFTRILDLLASASPDSDGELLEAVRKARRDMLRSEGAAAQALPARTAAQAVAAAGVSSTGLQDSSASAPSMHGFRPVRGTSGTKIPAGNGGIASVQPAIRPSLHQPLDPSHPQAMRRPSLTPLMSSLPSPAHAAPLPAAAAAAAAVTAPSAAAAAAAGQLSPAISASVATAAAASGHRYTPSRLPSSLPAHPPPSSLAAGAGAPFAIAGASGGALSAAGGALVAGQQPLIPLRRHAAAAAGSETGQQVGASTVRAPTADSTGSGGPFTPGGQLLGRAAGKARKSMGERHKAERR